MLSTFNTLNRSRFSGYLNFSRNCEGGTHPGWPVHLYMADLYAGIFAHDTHHYCALDSEEKKTVYTTNLKLRSRTADELPTPLSSSADFQCNKKLLDLSHEIVTQNLNPVGQYRFEPEKGGWNLTVDKVGRTGGFIVTKHASDKSRVIFMLNITTKELVEKKLKFQLYIHYLRSYDSGGIVQVSLCNTNMSEGPTPKSQGILDGLWDDYKTHRHSLPDLFAPESYRLDHSMCKSFMESRPTIEVTFHRKDSEIDRGNQKFKLMNIKLCLQ